MLNIPFLILAAGSLSTLIAGAPIPSSPLSVAQPEEAAPFKPSLSLNKRTTIYNVLGGDGKIAVGWPGLDAWWPTFDEMFEANRDTMKQSCTQWNVPNNSDDEISDISTAIQEVAASSGVDARYILAIVIQESNGCVRAPTTDNGVINPGLMQSHNGVGSCNNGEVLSPCPSAQIKQMITDGTVGTSDGDGLVACLKQAGGTGDVANYYRAARIYNSGSIDASGNLGRGIATHCYSSDVGNRLTGWATGPSSCVPDSIGSLTSAVTTYFRFASSSSSSDESDDTTTTTTATTTTTTSTTHAPAPTTTTTSTTTTTTAAPAATTEAEVEPTTTAPATTTYTLVSVTSTTTTTASTEAPATSVPAASSTAAPIYPYANSNCEEYYTVEAGDYCLKVEAEIGVSVDQLRKLNSGLKKDCTNLWLGYQYCIKA